MQWGNRVVEENVIFAKIWLLNVNCKQPEMFYNIYVSKKNPSEAKELSLGRIFCLLVDAPESRCRLMAQSIRRDAMLR